jgi:deazaflavin-dependent oxidoreductase (nitroreductase family)
MTGGPGRRPVEPGTSRMILDARDAFVKFWATWHEAVYEVTGGRTLNRLLGMTVVQLTTTGRRTGQPRTTMLTAPIVEDGLIVLVASNGGDERHPQWYRNILVCSEVAVTLDGVTRPMNARVAGEEERVELWGRIREIGPTYHLYQGHTTRQLPIVVLEPVLDGASGSAGPPT